MFHNMFVCCGVALASAAHVQVLSLENAIGNAASHRRESVGCASSRWPVFHCCPFNLIGKLYRGMASTSPMSGRHRSIVCGQANCSKAIVAASVMIGIITSTILTFLLLLALYRIVHRPAEKEKPEPAGEAVRLSPHMAE